MRAYRLIAPLRRNEELLFAEIEAPEQVVLDYRNTVKAPKAALFPQTECMIRFPAPPGPVQRGAGCAPGHRPPRWFLGIRPCDARSYLFMDRIFGQGPYFDPYYRARRESTLVFSLACDRPRQTCFCHAFGSGPYDRQGSDVFMRDAGDAYLVEAVSERGAQALQGLRRLPRRRWQSRRQASRGSGRRDRGQGHGALERDRAGSGHRGDAARPL